ncbi:MAG: ABC transporter ATP-binding protein [Myxococcales bacterium]|nr:ABC transporter ATP-binding protein [Myxococcales bacterium]
MLKIVREIPRLIAPDDRRRIAWLLPLMIGASSSDVIMVLGASAFLKAIAHPERYFATFGIGYLSPSGAGITMALGMLVMVLLSNAVSVFATHRLSQFGFRQQTFLSEGVLGSILRRPYPWFLHQNTAVLKQHALVETGRVVQAQVVLSLQIAARALGALTIVAYLLWEEPVVTTALGISLSTFYYLLFTSLRRTMRTYGERRAAADRQRSHIAHEALLGVKEIKLHALESSVLKRFHEPNVEMASALTIQSTMTRIGKPALEVVGVTGLVLIVVFFLATGRPLDGVLVLIGSYAVAAYRLLPTVQQGFAWLMRLQAEAAAARIVLSHIDAPLPTLTGAEPVTLEHEIALEGVRFTYPQTEQPVLEGIDVHIPRGTWVALVGSTGSGKTTLVDLIMGLLQPDEGCVRIDDRRLQDLADAAAWQTHIGYVPQSLFMSDTTVAGNIAFGQDVPDMDLVRAVARMACVADFVETELPQGYDTPIGERGMRLSGGQRQRLGIARSLYRKPELLVLDEATSALDNRTEAAVVDALRENFASTTVIMIAHRLSTTRYCDQILVLERGKIIARGSYDDLLETSAYFRTLVEASNEAPAVREAPAEPDASDTVSPVLLEELGDL